MLGLSNNSSIRRLVRQKRNTEKNVDTLRGHSIAVSHRELCFQNISTEVTYDPYHELTATYISTLRKMVD